MEDYGLVALVMEKEDNFIDYFNTIQGADLAAGLKCGLTKISFRWNFFLNCNNCKKLNER